MLFYAVAVYDDIVLFLVVLPVYSGKKAVTKKLGDLTYREALFIGLFQLIAAIFPGTSRSGARNT